MTASTDTARRLLERADDHPVVSLFFDLDPERFATAPARTSQLTSLVDEALRSSRNDTSLGHYDRQAVEDDLARLRSYMESGEAPISGARGLAVFLSGDLLEAVSQARLVLGGPAEDVDRFAELLPSDLRRVLADLRLPLDVEIAGVADVRAATEKLVESEEAVQQTEALAQLEDRLAAGGNAALGLEPTLTALDERRVERLVLDHNFQAEGARCPTCRLLYPEGTTACPADGTRLEPVPDLREAAVEAAVLQDAAVTVVGEGSDPPPPVLLRGGGIGALLRF